ncbi:hypothetical protein PBCV1_a074L [Paramecium bursaria Chlorella virus 1]|uniref:Uncharacterized protein n=1 Tax=Paramecium bursaria Chlorella virus 1 TaxID=10506 RepID=Q89409_PBCV1|nr:hypothetical protein PBCV1_a074L [Paramecium bursaria Chlorella virus 1]AAC96442.1 hypothetical protein [Paramecium bursaria Chlorella virus 1]
MFTTEIHPIDSFGKQIIIDRHVATWVIMNHDVLRVIFGDFFIHFIFLEHVTNEKEFVVHRLLRKIEI